MFNILKGTIGAVGFPKEIAVVAVDFDGANDWLDIGSDLTGNANGKEGLLAFWFLTNGTAGTEKILGNAQTGGFDVFTNASGEIVINAVNTSATLILNVKTATPNLDDNAWHHFLASWDLATTTAQIFIDDVSDLSSTTVTDDTIDYTGTDFAIGANEDGSNKLNGGLSEVFFKPTFLDLSIIANRRKFISVNAKPVDLSSAGTSLIKLNQALATWQNNQGTGGGFTENGALTAAASSPSD